MNLRTLTALIPVSILAAAMAASNAQKNKKQLNAEKITANLPKSAPAKPDKARKVLVFSKTAGFRHGSIPTGVEAMKQMGKSTGAFEVTATEDDSFFEPDKLKEFDAVIFLNTTGEVFKSKEEGREDKAVELYGTWPGEEERQRSFRFQLQSCCSSKPGAQSQLNRN